MGYVAAMCGVVIVATFNRRVSLAHPDPSLHEDDVLLRTYRIRGRAPPSPPHARGNAAFGLPH